MREIEFRGFCEGYNDNKCFEISLLALKECGWSCDKGIGVSIPYQPHVKIMQYTGLKDKNGKKIYEGDIIRLDDKYRRLISSANAKTEEDLVRKDCLVGFKDGSFMFCRNRYVINDFDSYLWLTNEHCEVIGNIYEDNNEKDR